MSLSDFRELSPKSQNLTHPGGAGLLLWNLSHSIKEKKRDKFVLRFNQSMTSAFCKKSAGRRHRAVLELSQKSDINEFALSLSP